MTVSLEDVAGRPLQAQLTRGLAAALKEVSVVADGRGNDAAAGLADALLLDALRERATDIHLEPRSEGVLVRFRIDGLLYDTLLLSRSEGARMVRHFKLTGGLDSSQHFVPGNARTTTMLDGTPVDLRLATLPCVTGEAMTIRVLDRSRVEQRLGRLGLAPTQHRQIEQWLGGAFGMFLVAGPTGHGKTTTLYALLHELRSHNRAIFTVEEPIEYEIDGVTQTQVDRKHGLGFSEGLRAILRLDPDYMLLGEIRGSDSARAAAEAAGTGRVLMSTIHSPDAVGVVSTLRGLSLSDREIVAALNVVVAQRLARRLCQHCRKRAATSNETLAYDGEPRSDAAWEVAGCDQCHGLGYHGRAGLFEVWQLSEEDRALILGHADERTLRRALRSRGFRTLVQDGYQKAACGITSLAEVRQVVANYPSATKVEKQRGCRMPRCANS